MTEEVVINSSKLEIELENSLKKNDSQSNSSKRNGSSLCPVTLEYETKILRLGFILLLLCLILVVLGYSLKEANGVSSNEYCDSQECVLSAANVIIKLDTSVNPCDDFYQFACGNYIKQLVLPEDKSFITALSDVSDRLSMTLERLVSENVSDSDTESTKMVKNFFNACMNTELIEEKGMEPLRNILTNLGGWPLLVGSQWRQPEETWVDTLIKMREIGFSTDYLFTFDVVTDVRNSSWRIIQLDQAKLGMPSRKYLLKGMEDKDVEAYEQFQINLATSALGAQNTSLLRREIRNNVQMEIDIANISISEEARRDIPSLYNKMSVKELSERIPSIPWLKVINGFLQLEEIISEDELILVSSPEYLVNLDNLLRAATKREIQNYILWHVSASACFYLSQSCRRVELEYSEKLFGVAKHAPRWKECMNLVSGELSFAVGALYVRKIFDQTSKSEAEKMVSYIMKTFRETLPGLNWMDSKTKETAIEKANLIKALIGFPSELLDEGVMMKHYGGLNMSETDLLHNMEVLSIYSFQYSSSQLRKKVIKTNWKTYGAAAIVNAFYSSIDNAILFPAGILQGVFFNVNRPKYMNYGAIGLVIGHEIIHGFDDEGSQFNATGDLQNWWDVETRKEFVNKSQCIVSQYSNYFIPEIEMHLNGKITLGENIADNGGTRVARHAYKKWSLDHGPEAKLPGLKYTPEQLFWISSAHLWCSKERDEYLKLSVLSKHHSPGRFRINGPASNSKEFSEDWGCFKSDNMNRKDKCIVW